MGKRWKQWQTLFSWAPKSLKMVTVAMKLKDACSLEKSYYKSTQRIKKQRHHFADKGLYSQGCGFSSSHVQMRELDHKEGQRIDAFKLWCWRRLFRFPWTLRRSNQSILKETNPDWCWSSNTLVTWSKQSTHWKRSWCWERFKPKGEEGSRGWDGWIASPAQWTWIWANSRR